LTQLAPKYQDATRKPQALGLPLADPIEVKRRLAAIFAADVEGYSRLMGADEVATLDALTARREILDGLIATHGGRIANTAGDSALAEFGSAVDAVRCAMEARGRNDREEVKRFSADVAGAFPSFQALAYRDVWNSWENLIRGRILIHQVGCRTPPWSGR
jgi:class 3 adenylate cyclase